MKKELKITPTFLKSLRHLLFDRLRTCDHEIYGLDSFDRANGEHLCHSTAIVKRKVQNMPQYHNKWRFYCEQHKKPGDEELSHAQAYRQLRKLLDKI